MKRYFPLLIAAASFCLVTPLVANDQFNQGMQQGSASKGQGASAIQGFKPAEVIPGYTGSPPESGYYGGVTSSGVDMTSPGSTALNTSEAGKTITESILNTPPDNKPSLDAPFISEGLAMKDKAETITGGGFSGCVDQPASFTEITTHQCLRDTKIEQYCTRTATLGYEGSTEYDIRVVEYELYDLPAWEENGDIVVAVTPQISGEITEATYSWSNGSGNKPRFYMTISFLGNNVQWHQKGTYNNVSFKPVPSSLTAGVPFTSRHPVNDG